MLLFLVAYSLFRVCKEEQWKGGATKLKANQTAFTRLMNQGQSEKGDGIAHRTIFLTTRADGAFRKMGPDGKWIPGAPAPMVIQTASASDKTKRHLSHAMKKGFLDESMPVESRKEGVFYAGLSVVAAENGSMRRELFPAW